MAVVGMVSLVWYSAYGGGTICMAVVQCGIMCMAVARHDSSCIPSEMVQVMSPCFSAASLVSSCLSMESAVQYIVAGSLWLAWIPPPPHTLPLVPSTPSHLNTPLI